MSISSFFYQLFHCILPDCLFPEFKRRKRVQVYHLNEFAVEQRPQRVHIQAADTFHQNFHRPLNIETPRLNSVRQLSSHRLPMPTLVSPHDQNARQQILFLPIQPQHKPINSRHPARAAIPMVCPQSHFGVHEQRQKLQNESEQLFANLNNRGFFHAQKQSPVILSRQNAEKQDEISATRQKLQHIFQFADKELLDIVKMATEAHEIIENSMDGMRLQLAGMDEAADPAIAEQYNDLAGLEGSIIALEKSFQDYLRKQQDRPVRHQNAEEAQMAVLLADIERLNRQKTLLENCQQGGVENAAELQQLLDAFEAEYQDLNQKCEQAKKELSLAEENIADLTGHLLNISECVDSFVLKYPAFANVRPNLQSMRLDQSAIGVQRRVIVDDVNPNNAATVGQRPENVQKLHDAAKKVEDALKALVKVSRRAGNPLDLLRN